MRKFLLSLVLLSSTLISVADEGMWLLLYLEKQNYDRMQGLGFKLTPEDLYSVNQPSMKDAIVIFGGGCTGEIVSANGLIFTNHHCGYGSIQMLSSVESDYLKNGFWAENNQGELPVKDLSVKFIRKICDVTPEVLGNYNMSADESIEKIYELFENKELVLDAKPLLGRYEDISGFNDMGNEIVIKPFFGGNQYFMFIMETYTDIRLVGAPPTSIGKFGGETDNWMWPRHTGDFSIFRVYADENNRPANYSADNRPYEADQFLKLSINGFEEGDYAMTIGFPGSTERYMSSYEIDELLEIENPQRIAIRGARQDILRKLMAENDTIRIKYSSKFAISSNYWKNSIGMSRGLKRLNIKEKKEKEEEAFQKWADEKTFYADGYMGALSSIKNGVEGRREYSASSQYLSETVIRSFGFYASAMTLLDNLDKPISKEERAELVEIIKDIYKDYDYETEVLVSKEMLKMLQENCKHLPLIFDKVINTQFEGNTDKYVDYLYTTSPLAKAESAIDYAAKVKSKKQLLKDPIVQFAYSVYSKNNNLSDLMADYDLMIKEGHKKYVAGLVLAYKDKQYAPDANFTIRMSYGQILPYRAENGEMYEYQTTLDGLIAKEDVNNPVEFTVEEKLKEIHREKDYGRYADKDGSMPVAFLSNNDITGGNSGSPVINANGELIGLAFDGNWEAMSGDIAFEPELQRTICLDVRYLLLIVDKYADAKWLLDELIIIDK
ncbi:MAG: S46 family peptidase [bacterium]